ncbi:MAG TPA: glycoside hydrolase family 15 protein, partial [Thermoplasmata archaeon]|nr:glycoside hydrolase family 15 protein [Thermoplasmata archaeon]
APRFDYAASTPELDVVARGVVARHGRERLSLRLPAPPQVSAGRAELTITIEPGRPVPIELTFGGFRSTTPGPIALFRRTERFWSRWVHGPTAPIHRIAGEWHAAVERSELVLKLLSEAGSGAFVAAPTTSLPEWPGGPRNWDYRYVWVRDSAFAAQEMLLLGHPAEARGFLAWVVRRIEAARASDNPLGVLYGAHGETDLAERELPDLSGFARSRPVRVGNAAASQFQLDVFGEILDAALLLSGLDEGFVRRRLASLLALAEVVAARWREPDQGIWEVRGPPAPYVHSKLMAWVAFDRAARLVEVLRPDGNASDRWRSEADGVRSYLLETAWDPSTGSFPQATGAAVVDAANLRIPHVGFLPYDDPKVLGTVDRVIRELGHGPFVYRYRGSDGLDGPEGTFLPCAFWLVECLARGGRRAEARDRFERLLSSASPLGLLPEEFDPDGFGPLGNFPQSLTHVALLRAAIALGFADAPASVRAELLRTMPDPSTAAGTPAPEKG